MSDVIDIAFAWSSGKDSSMALFVILEDKHYAVKSLFTTVTKGYDRVSMHGVRESLLDKQAESLNIPLKKVYISQNSSHDEYEKCMESAMSEYLKKGIRNIAFGDIFLEDLKEYRSEKLSSVGMLPLFPIWNRETKKLANDFIDLGFKAIVTCADSKFLDASYAGKEFDQEFLSSLPAGVDPCGENGEFHTFVYDGPIFSKKLDIEKGEVVLRDERFYFCDLY